MYNKVLYLLLSLILAIGISACQDDILTQENANSKEGASPKTEMQRIVVNSPDDIAALINQMGDSNNPATRAESLITPDYSDGEQQFVSLYEANKTAFMNSLSLEELEIIRNDPDSLEYCPSDSIIADMQFAMLLNASREIQVGHQVYKYYSNGIAIAHKDYAYKLNDIDEYVSTIKVTEENAGQVMVIVKDIDFIPMLYLTEHFDIDNGFGDIGGSVIGGGGGISPGNTIGLQLEGGINIPTSDIRTVYFHEKGDGNFFHRLWTGIFGRNIVACKKFTDNKKLTLNFYDQNYIIYSNIGTTLKMQKRVLGIWWNIKAPRMIHGWDAVSLRYSLTEPMPPTSFTMQGMTNPTITTTRSYLFGDKNTILFHIPIANYDFTSEDFNKVFKLAIEKAYTGASKWAQSQADQAGSKGLIGFDNKEAYVIYEPYITFGENKRSMSTKFYATWFSGTAVFQFSISDIFKLKNIKLSLNDGVDLHRGCVYGAIYYDGKWLGAKIIKNQ